MSKSLQILLAVIVAVCLLLGFLISWLIAPGHPESVAPPTAPAPAPRSIRWPLPWPGEERRQYAREGREVFLAKGCWTCHRLGAEPLPGPIVVISEGPDLDRVGARLTTDEIVESILNPNAVIANPPEKYAVGRVSRMPSPVETLSTGELLRLVAFLADRNGNFASDAGSGTGDATPSLPADLPPPGSAPIRPGTDFAPPSPSSPPVSPGTPNSPAPTPPAQPPPSGAPAAVPAPAPADPPAPATAAPPMPLP